jgi:hypothetical protein
LTQGEINWTRAARSEVVIITIGESLLLSFDNFLLHLEKLVFGNDDFSGGEEGGLDKGEVGIVDQAAEKPDEGLLELVVALGRDVVVLEVLLTVEGDLLGLNLAVTHVDFVADKHDGDGLAHTGQILVPLGHVGVSDARAHIEHDDTTVASNIVTITKASKLLLTSGIPNVEVDLTVVGEEGHGVDFDSESGDVPLLEFSGQMTLDERSLADTAVTDEDELELWNLLLLLMLNHLKKKRG